MQFKTPKLVKTFNFSISWKFEFSICGKVKCQATLGSGLKFTTQVASFGSPNEEFVRINPAFLLLRKAYF